MKKLLFSVTKDDFILQAFRAGGPGGQKQNKTSSAVRIIHPLSGAAGESRSSRHQHENRHLAFQHLVSSSKFQAWLKLKIARYLATETVEQSVEKLMAPRNIRVETMSEDGCWEDSPCLSL